MNDEQKQIVEMAKVLQGIIYYAPDEEDDRYRYLTHLDKQSAEEIAKALIAAGYRKQSDTAREILQMIKDKGLFRYGGYLLHDSDFDTIGKLYGVEVEK